MGKIIKGLFLLAIVSVLLFGIWKIVKLSGITEEKSLKFYQSAYVTLGQLRPEQQTVDGGPLRSGFTLNRQDDYTYFSQLNKSQPAAKDSLIFAATTLLKTLQALDIEHDSIYELTAFNLKSLSDPGVPYPLYELLSIPNGELYQTPFRLCYAHEIPNPQMAEAYLSRIRQLGPKADNWATQVTRLAAEGALRNPAVLRTAAAYCTGFATIAAERHPLYLSFARRMARKGDIRVNQDDAIDLLDRVASLLTDRVLPSWKKLGESLSTAATSAATISGMAVLNAGLKAEGIPPLDKSAVAVLLIDLNAERAALQKGLSEAISELDGTSGTRFFPPNYTAQASVVWIDSLYWLMDDLKLKSAGAFPNLPEFNQYEFELQDSLMQILKHPVWYMPGDLDGTRKAVLFVHPTVLGAANGTARETLIRWGVPGLHTALAAQRDSIGKPLIIRSMRLPAWEGGWQHYSAMVADEIGLNLDPNSRTPAPDYGKALFYQRQLTTCELALAELRHYVQHDGTIEGFQDFVSDSLSKVSDEALVQSLSRPGMHLAAWQYFRVLRSMRSREQAKAGKLFYLGDFHRRILKEGLFLVE